MQIDALKEAASSLYWHEVHQTQNNEIFVDLAKRIRSYAEDIIAEKSATNLSDDKVFVAFAWGDKEIFIVKPKNKDNCIITTGTKYQASHFMKDIPPEEIVKLAQVMLREFSPKEKK